MVFPLGSLISCSLCACDFNLRTYCQMFVFPNVFFASSNFFLYDSVFRAIFFLYHIYINKLFSLHSYSFREVLVSPLSFCDEIFSLPANFSRLLRVFFTNNCYIFFLFANIFWCTSIHRIFVFAIFNFLSRGRVEWDEFPDSLVYFHFGCNFFFSAAVICCFEYLFYPVSSLP